MRRFSTWISQREREMPKTAYMGLWKKEKEKDEVWVWEREREQEAYQTIPKNGLMKCWESWTLIKVLLLNWPGIETHKC